MSDRTGIDERLHDLLDRAAAGIPLLPDEELAGAARAASADGHERVLQLAGRNGSPARRRSPPARWALALAAAFALALAGGIGIGHSLTGTAESASAPVLPAVKPGFEPAGGWTVRAGAGDGPWTHVVVAANIPFEEPERAIATMPADGILVTVHGRAGAGGPARAQLGAVAVRIGDAVPATRWVGPAGRERALAEYVLAASAGGLELEVRVLLGTTEPSRVQLAAAQAQLDRLVLRTAANDVTISARPTTVRWAEQVALAGAVAGGRTGERVMIEVRECGTDYWRVVDMATTTSGGRWSSEAMMSISGSLRARTDAGASAAVRISARPGVVLNPWRSPFTRVAIVGVRPFWGRLVTLQRFDAPRQRWIAVATARVTKSNPSGNFIWSEASFRTSVTRRGTLYRAVISNQQTGACYLAGFSNLARR